VGSHVTLVWRGGFQDLEKLPLPVKPGHSKKGTGASQSKLCKQSTRTTPHSCVAARQGSQNVTPCCPCWCLWWTKAFGSNNVMKAITTSVAEFQVLRMFPHIREIRLVK
jgi:hypothetical protein